MRFGLEGEPWSGTFAQDAERKASHSLARLARVTRGADSGGRPSSLEGPLKSSELPGISSGCSPPLPRSAPFQVKRADRDHRERRGSGEDPIFHLPG